MRSNADRIMTTASTVRQLELKICLAEDVPEVLHYMASPYVIIINIASVIWGAVETDTSVRVGI